MKTEEGKKVLMSKFNMCTNFAGSNAKDEVRWCCGRCGGGGTVHLSGAEMQVTFLESITDFVAGVVQYNSDRGAPDRVQLVCTAMTSWAAPLHPSDAMRSPPHGI